MFDQFMNFYESNLFLIKPTNVQKKLIAILEIFWSASIYWRTWPTEIQMYFWSLRMFLQDTGSQMMGQIEPANPSCLALGQFQSPGEGWSDLVWTGVCLSSFKTPIHL